MNIKFNGTSSISYIIGFIIGKLLLDGALILVASKLFGYISGVVGATFNLPTLNEDFFAACLAGFYLVKLIFFTKVGKNS